MAALKHTERRTDDVVILALKGRITIGKGDVRLRQLVRDLVDRGEKKILLDLGKVSYLDSSGTGELVSAYTSAKRQGAELKLLNVTARAYDILTFTQLITVFDHFRDEQEAVAAFASDTGGAARETGSTVRLG